MLNVCVNCGEYRADKTIDPAGPYAICPVCGHAHAFAQLPLFVLSGAGGTGKSTVCLELVGRLPEVVVLDSDILWTEEFMAPAQWPKYFNLWLRMCKNINQSGRPVLLAGAGLGVPANLTSCVEARYFSAIHFLALVCDDEVLATRLRARPGWRQSGSDEFVADHVRFNRWFKEEGSGQTPPVALLDTTDLNAREVAARVAEWIRN